MSGGLTPRRQLWPSSRSEHVNASTNHKLFIKACTVQLLSKNLKSILAWQSLKGPGKREPGKLSSKSATGKGGWSAPVSLVCGSTHKAPRLTWGVFTHAKQEINYPDAFHSAMKKVSMKLMYRLTCHHHTALSDYSQHNTITLVSNSKSHYLFKRNNEFPARHQNKIYSLLEIVMML